MVSRQNPERSLPKIPSWPLLGNYFEFRRDGLSFLIKAAHKHGGVCAFHVGPRLAILISSAEFARSVLYDSNTRFLAHRPTGKRTMQALLGEGVIFQEGNSHKKRRRQLNPFFHPRRLANYVAPMAAAVDRIQREWRDGDEIELFQSMRRMTIAAIGASIFQHHDMREL